MRPMRVSGILSKVATLLLLVPAIVFVGRSLARRPMVYGPAPTTKITTTGWFVHVNPWRNVLIGRYEPKILLYRFSNWHLFGVGEVSISTGTQTIGSMKFVSIPWWTILLVALGSTVPGIIARRRLMRRRAAGLCAVCGYDLRATPQRCPECGTETPAGGSSIQD